ncbi:MAG: hypothetical protein JSS75_12130 [Bacteroidetes bacterium]|nr:hypothetical protein [Bacteroidota bacterium]
MKRLIIYRLALVAVLVLALVCSASAQQIRVARIQPDAIATNMTMAMEILAPAADTGAFGADGIYLPDERLQYLNAADSVHVIFGPVCVSWHGRVMQVPIMAPRIAGTANQGSIGFVVTVGNRRSSPQQLSLVQPQSTLSLVGSGVIGSSGLGTLTHGNTLVVDSLDLSGTNGPPFDAFSIDTENPDSGSANPRYHPITILALRGVTIDNVQLSVSANGLNGGPGGGGGGGGFSSSGGAGYTGGGSDTSTSSVNAGSGSGPTQGFGGASSTGVLGGASSGTNSDNPDQGAGGGTGCPYGSSGVYSSGNSPSEAGGFGGASAGGELPGIAYGGGGGGFALDGESGAGVGKNNGHAYGGRFLIPMMGGSGGGAGNAQQGSDSTTGSGGGGGGAVTIVSFGAITLNNSMISARGARGTSGTLTKEAGGGGGSGGSMYLAARHSVILNSATVATDGGVGGLGGIIGDTNSVALNGGNGSIGRLRFDGRYNDTCSACHLVGAVSSGLVLIPTDSQLHGPTNIIGGISGSKRDLLDSIRVFYRNHHSPWQVLDTVRDTAGTQPLWNARLPLGHDSLLFVVVYEKVSAPHTDPADAEPEWLTGHLASAAVRVVPTPHPVAHTDTLDLGCILLSDSVSAPLFLTNLGEAAFIVQSTILTDPTHFAIVRDTSRFDGYVTDSLVIRYTPHTGPRKDTAILQLISENDTVTVVLIGCAIDKDERVVLSKRALDFGRVHVGDCPEQTFTVKSVGSDPVLVHCAGLVNPPFSVVSPTKDTLLHSPDSLKIRIRYCPTDSGVVHASFVLTDRRDSINVNGVGTVRILRPESSVAGSILCSNACDSVRLVLHSDGNDPVRLDGISGATILSPRLPMTIPARTDTEIVVRYCNLGTAADTIRLASNADTTSEAVILFTPRSIAFAIDGRTSFGPLCLTQSDSATLSIVSTASGTLQFDSVHLPIAPFIISGATSGNDSLGFSIRFIPTSSGQSTDSMVVFAHSGTCDTVLTLHFTGSAHDVVTLYSSSTLDFGSVDSGSCRDTTLLVSLACGVDTISIGGVNAPFTLIDPSDGTIILKQDSTATIRLRYCPTRPGRDSLVITAHDINGSTPITLVGSAAALQLRPQLHFTLAHIAVQAGVPFTYRISIDTAANAQGLDSIYAVLTYDPMLLEANSISSPVWTVSGSERKPGEFEIFAHGASLLTNGLFANVEMMPFYALKNTSTIDLTNIETFASGTATTTPGDVTVADCSNLSGTIIVTGPYSIDRLYANPVSSLLDLDVTTGATGAIDVRVYDLTGAAALRSRTSELARGKHRISIDVSSLPNGVYRVMLESLGWREGATFIVQH